MKLFFLEEMFQLATFAFYACPMTKLLTLSWWKFYDVIDVLFILPYICVSFPKKTIKDFVEGFGFTFQDNGGRYWSWFYSKRYIYIFCTFLQKYTGDLTGNVVDSMMNAEGCLYFTGWGLVDRSLATGLVSWLQIGNDGRMW